MQRLCSATLSNSVILSLVKNPLVLAGSIFASFLAASCTARKPEGFFVESRTRDFFVALRMTKNLWGIGRTKGESWF